MRTRIGWHLKHSNAPHKGQATVVDPIRRKRDVAEIKDHLQGNARDYAIFTVGINTGLRAGDLLSLKFADVLTPDGLVKPKLTIVEQKTQKNRVIALGTKAREALAALCPKDMDDVDLDAYVFASRKGGRMTIQRLHQLINKWAEAAGLKGNFGTHTLRKTFAYHILKQGSDINALMKILNHSSPSVTLRYAGIEQEDMDNVVLKLNL